MKKEVHIENIGGFQNREKIITEILKQNKNNRFDSFCLKKGVLTLTFIEELAPNKRIMVKQINKRRTPDYENFVNEITKFSSWEEIGKFELKSYWVVFFQKKA